MSHNNNKLTIKRSQDIKQMKMQRFIICSLCLFASLTFLTAKTAEAGRLQEFIQNLVGGGSGSSSSSSGSSSSGNSGSGSSGNSNSNSNSNNNNNDSNDPDTAAAGENQGDQHMTPMMSAMSPFLRYPSFYDNFAQASSGAYSGFPGFSFSNPMTAMSGLSPMAAMSSQSFGSAFSPASFGPGSFGAAFGSPGSSPSASNPMSAFGAATQGLGAASSMNNVYASSPNLMAGYSPYYGRRK